MLGGRQAEQVVSSPTSKVFSELSIGFGNGKLRGRRKLFSKRDLSNLTIDRGEFCAINMH
jgi:hypothetical protein